MSKKAIAIMTSGGDSPGMNAAARAVVRTAIYAGVDVYGINNGYKGMIEDDIIQLNGKSVSDIIQRGGTFLGTARSKEFMTPEGRAKAYANLEKRGINGLCVIGGDGSLRGAAALAKEHGISIVGLPGTIDNDVWGSDYTIGCDTAANTIIDAINKLRDTASAHRRCAVLEVMGRRCGWLAMVTGIAGGAEYILVPEVNYDLEEIISEIKDLYENNKKRYIMVVVAEGAGKAVDIAEKIQQETGIETRPTVLGHVQRGGSPTVRDRVIASKMGHEAVQLLKKGIGNRVVCLNKGEIVDKDIFEALNEKKSYEFDLHKVAHDISI